MSAGIVLFVDDDPGVLGALRRAFRRSDFDILTASSGTEGLARLTENDVDVVVSDQRMEDMPGTEFLREVRALYPRAIRCILSGYAEVHAILAAINDGNVYRFVAKPWDDNHLESVLHECLELAHHDKSRRRATSELFRRAASYKREREEIARQLASQSTLVHASRAMLDKLPIAVAALDPSGSVAYTNARFNEQFGPPDTDGHIPTEGWSDLAGLAADDATRTLHVPSIQQDVHVSAIEIGGEPYTLLAVPTATLARE